MKGGVEYTGTNTHLPIYTYTHMHIYKHTHTSTLITSSAEIVIIERCILRLYQSGLDNHVKVLSVVSAIVGHFICCSFRVSTIW